MFDLFSDPNLLQYVHEVLLPAFLSGGVLVGTLLFSRWQRAARSRRRQQRAAADIRQLSEAAPAPDPYVVAGDPCGVAAPCPVALLETPPDTTTTTTPADPRLAVQEAMRLAMAGKDVSLTYDRDGRATIAAHDPLPGKPAQFQIDPQHFPDRAQINPDFWKKCPDEPPADVICLNGRPPHAQAAKEARLDGPWKAAMLPNSNPSPAEAARQDQEDARVSAAQLAKLNAMMSGAATAAPPPEQTAEVSIYDRLEEMLQDLPAQTGTADASTHKLKQALATTAGTADRATRESVQGPADPFARP